MIIFSKSAEKIWWNKGNEVKPNFEEFNQINWELLPNFNVNYINEMTINLTITNDNDFDLLKIEDTDKNEITYWYLETILNKTKLNKKCTFTLDLWATYILTKKFDLKKLSTNRYVRTSDMSGVLWRWTKADSVGYPNHEYKFKFLENKENFNREFKTNPENQTPLLQTFRWHNLTTYFVFTDRHNPNFRGENGIIAIPLLLEDNNMILNGQVGDADFKYPDYIIEKGTHTHYILNSLINLEYFVKNKQDWQDKHNVGEFLGVYQGPNFFRISDLGIVAQMSIAGQQFMAESEITIKERLVGNKWSTLGFLCLRIPNRGKDIAEYDTHNFYEDFKNGYNQLNLKENINFALSANKLYFINGFVLSSAEKTVELQTEIPYFYDKFYEIWMQQKASRDNSINIAKQQMAAGIAKSVLSGVGMGITSAANFAIGNIGTGTGLAGMAVTNTAMGINNAVLQYQNTLKTFEAQKKDLQAKTTTELLNSQNIYYQELSIQYRSKIYDSANNQPLGQITETGKRAKEILYGNITEDLTNSFNFFGWETIFQVTDQDIQNIRKAYLIWDETFKNIWSTNNVSPNIRAGITTLLTNGVRVATKQEIENGFA